MRTLFVATRKGLFTFARRGKGSWRAADAAAFLAVPVSMVLQDPRDGAVYAALEHGHFGPKLHRSRGGRTDRFEEIATPAFPPAKKRSRPEVDGFGKPWPRTVKTIFALEIDPQRRGGLWCGTIPGGLFRSGDRGASWRLDDALWNHPGRRKWFGGGTDLPAIHSIAVHPRDPAQVAIGVSCGGVWHTDDGGASWSVGGKGMRAEYVPKSRASDPGVQDPHRVVQCRSAPERLWAQHHNGIFRTKANGRDWVEVKGKAPSRFGFACAVHPEDPDRAWFVPAQKDECRVPVGARLCVTRTRDGGRTFEVLARGLPSGPAYDLVLRHALDIAPDGDTLAFGSTTGGLWVTENGGAGWTELSHNLPPVYAVRFGAE